MKIFRAFLIAAVCVVGYRCDCKDKFKKSEIVPAIIPNAPDMALEILYNNQSIVCGSNVSVSLTMNAPLLKFNCDGSKIYTLVMIDVDSLTKEFNIFSPYRHWLITDILGCNMKSGKLQSTYMQPNPTPGLGPHRYIMLIYEQTSPINNTQVGVLDRARFDLNGFVKTNDLQGPVAGNFFYVGFSLIDVIKSLWKS